MSHLTQVGYLILAAMTALLARHRMSVTVRTDDTGINVTVRWRM
jgi:hypothetical protein